MKTTFPTLQSERLTLRQFTDSDLENVYKGLSHPEVIKYYGVSYKTLEETKIQMKWFADLEKEETGMWWAICSKEDGTFLGGVGLNDWSKEHEKAEIGFWLLPENWGKGYISESVPLVCDYAFNQMGLHRLEAFVDPENANCKKAMSRLGFKLEGTMIDCEVKNGAFVSLDIYANVKGENSKGQGKAL